MNIEEPTNPTVIVEEGYLRWREDLQYGKCNECMFLIERRCRRFPPQYIENYSGDSSFLGFPLIEFKNYGCGEFRKREK